MTQSINLMQKNKLFAAFLLGATTLVNITGCFSNTQIENHTHNGEDIAAPSNNAIYTAQGNEPDWMIKVNNNNILTFSSAESETDIHFEAAPVAFAKGIEYTGNYAGKPFVLVITGNECFDTMQDKTYAMTAVFEFKGQIFKGCATQN